MTSFDTGDAVAHDVVGVVRYRFDQLPTYERRFGRSIAVNTFLLGFVLVIALAWLVVVPALGSVALVPGLLFLLVGAIPAYTLASMRRFRRGLPRPGGPDVAVVVRRSGLDLAWPDLGPTRLTSLTWGDIAAVDQRRVRAVSVLRVRTRRRPAGSWWRVAYIPQDLLDTSVDLVVRDVHTLTRTNGT
ncbi:hypothetical protein [Mumia sp. Pv 4-285]|uniref:hypothetical protein n=1 Tax=Mumia qirimensis TaxID=3234852 RepID=UPI00351DA32D